MRDFSELNLNEGGKPVKRAPPSSEEISAFEREFGISLLPDYISLLTYSNGGHPELDSIAPMGRHGIAMWSINRFFYLNDDRESSGGLWAAARAWRQVLGEKQIPIAADEGGNLFVLDMSTSPPSVSGCFCDEGFDRVEIATTFSEFIDGLKLDPDMS